MANSVAITTSTPPETNVEKYTTLNGQVVFVLPKPPISNDSVTLIFGGCSYKEKMGDFTITGLNLTWTGGFFFDTGDVVLIEY